MTWKDGYRQALLRVLARRGWFVGNADSIYLWMDLDRVDRDRPHLLDCGVHPDTPVPTEVDWVEFESTVDGALTRHGVQGNVSCRCGRITSALMRLDVTLGELIHDVLAEPDEK